MDIIVQLINARYLELNGTPLNFIADNTFVEQMISVGADFPHYFITADPQEGIDKLNDVLVRRAMKAVTTSDPAGQYYAGNVLFRDTRSFRSDDDGTQDHVRQLSAVTLAGNVYQRRNAKFQEEQAQMRVQFLNTPYEERFARTKARPTALDDFKEL
jgi:hypothetical protein